MGEEGPKSAPGPEFISHEFWWLSLRVGQRLETWRIERISLGKFA
jgi:hypothetical protein